MKNDDAKILKEMVKVKRNILKNIKLTSSELKEIQSRANIYCGGNLSAWVRASSMNYKPKKKDLVKA